ncbi:MAG TPA: hypothetical protein VJ596_11415 [Gemmatimonadaceae bacterium]|nr:hypothetical protein [Gemmatimonadaceae bacterium]
MSISVQVGMWGGSTSPVEYRWDADTDILTANLRDSAPGEGMSGSVELAGSDGSFVMLDVKDGRIRSVEVAVWPDVRKVPALDPPATVQDADVIVPSRSSQSGVSLLQVDTPLVAEADHAERTIHFKLGSARPSKTLRIASDILLEVDDHSAVIGIWLLNVPPFPADE